jgi:hypothetical protein
MTETENVTQNIVPISVPNDDSTVELEGLFFNMIDGFREEDEPEQAIEIEKDVLDRSSGYIVGRFRYKVAARAKIVFKVSFDGKVLGNFGSGVPYCSGEGTIDPTLFKYPNSAKANKPGVHKVKVEYGLITGISSSHVDLTTWGDVKAKGVADFTICLLPSKIVRD